MKICTTPSGPARVGDFVHYRGSLTRYRGQIMELKAIYRGYGLTLTTAAGGTLRRVRTSSIIPCGPDCTQCPEREEAPPAEAGGVVSGEESSSVLRHG